MNVTVGINPITWTNDDMPEEAAAVEAHLSLLAAMGCKVLEFAEGYGSTGGDRTREWDSPISAPPPTPPDSRWHCAEE